MTQTEERRLTGLRSLTRLRAGHYKFICAIHTVCFVGMVILGIVTLNNMEERLSVFSSHLWLFILASELFILAVTDVIIATKRKGNVRNERGSVSGLVKLQGVLSLLSVPCYLFGYMVFFLKLDETLIVPGTVLYYIGFVSSMFVTCNCCYATLGFGILKRNNTDEGVISVSAIRMNEELTDPPPYTRYSHVEPPPNYTPCTRVNQSLDQLNGDPPPRYTPYPQAVTERAIPTSEITQNMENEQREVRPSRSVQIAHSIGTRPQTQMQSVQINSLNVRNLEAHF